MERKQPASGEFYRHFKGNLYQIKMLAKDSETQALTVVYQGMYPPFEYWVRGLQEFMEPVDRDKYPDCSQKYRFEKVEMSGYMAEKKLEQETVKTGEGFLEKKADIHEGGTEEAAISEKEDSVGRKIDTEVAKSLSHEMFRKAIISGQPERYLKDVMTDEQVAEQGFLELLDAESFREKRQIFAGLRNYLTPLLLSNIAVALDIVLEEEEEEAQYDSILKCLQAFEHYEGGRLR